MDIAAEMRNGTQMLDREFDCVEFSSSLARKGAVVCRLTNDANGNMKKMH